MTTLKVWSIPESLDLGINNYQPWIIFLFIVIPLSKRYFFVSLYEKCWTETSLYSGKEKSELHNTVFHVLCTADMWTYWCRDTDL